MKKLLPILLSILFISFFPSSRAKAAFIDLNFLYFSDTLTTSSTVTTSRTSYDLGFGLTFGSGNRWLGGLNFGGGTFEDAATTTTSYAFTDLGIKIGFFLSPRKTWLTTLAYNISSTADYDNGTSTYTLRGTSIKADLGYCVWIMDSVAVALKLYYYLPSITESVLGTTLTEVSYSRSTIYPGFSLMGTF